MNLVVLTGRLVRDPELKYGQSGKAYCKFTLAVNRMRKDDPADFISCAAFGKTAELIGEYMSKGSQMGIQGRIQTGTYEKDGNKVYTTDIMVDKIEFLGGGKNNSGSNNSGGKTKTYNEPKQSGVVEEEDDEFPF